MQILFCYPFFVCCGGEEEGKTTFYCCVYAAIISPSRADDAARYPANILHDPSSSSPRQRQLWRRHGNNKWHSTEEEENVEVFFSSLPADYRSGYCGSNSSFSFILTSFHIRKTSAFIAMGMHRNTSRTRTLNVYSDNSLADASYTWNMPQ